MEEEIATHSSILFFFFNNFIYLFIYFWLHWAFAAQGLFSSSGQMGGYSVLIVAVHGLLTAVASIVVEHRL